MKRIQNEKTLRVCSHKGIAYPAALRHAALCDYLSGMPRSAVALKYSLPDASLLSTWKRKFASCEQVKSSLKMVKRRNKRLLVTDLESAQSQRILELERALSCCEKELSKREIELRSSRLQLHLCDTMIDMAEELYQISIRKNFGSK